jgi:hypothetical protein
MAGAQYTANNSATTGATSTTILPERSGILKRTQLIITNTGAVAVTIVKGSNAAVLNQGIILQTNGVYLESTDGGYLCWQGEIQAISLANGSLSIVESFKEN